MLHCKQITDSSQKGMQKRAETAKTITEPLLNVNFSSHWPCDSHWIVI